MQSTTYTLSHSLRLLKPWRQSSPTLNLRFDLVRASATSKPNNLTPLTNPSLLYKSQWSIETYSFALNRENLTQQSQWFSPSRISSLKTSQSHHKPLVTAATLASSIHILFGDSMDPASLESELSMPEKALHVGMISCVDIMDGEVECVSVGEDGRVNLLSVGESELSYQQILDNSDLVSFTTAKWASLSEFATGGYGFSL